MEKGWSYCPSCGFRVERGFFDDMFSRIKRELFDREMKAFERQAEALDLSPFFRNPKGGGFSIKIYRSGASVPKVYVKTFGDVDRNQVEKAVYSQLGVRDKGVQELRRRATQIQREEKKTATGLKQAEEPRTSVRSLGDRVVVDIDLPGVKSPGEISINELENSVEVKAMVGDKAFFKILTKPPQFRVVQRTFSNNTLHLEFA